NTGENVDLVDTTNNVETEGDEERQSEKERITKKDRVRKKQRNREGNTGENVDLVDTTNNVETEGDEERQIDEDNNVDDVDVDMEDFEYNIDEEVDDDEASRLRKRKLKKISKQAHASEHIYKTYFYVGKEFPNKEEVNAYIKEHSIETRREIRLKKNDNERVRAI
nr:transposase, mutator type [Tanacetum cinerariifolium]